MKKLILAALAVPFILSSCDTETKDSTMTTSANSYNLITDLDTHTSFVSNCTYKFLENLSKNTVSVSTSDLKIKNRDHSFASEDQKYNTYYAQVGNTYQTVVTINDIKADFDNDALTPIKNYKALLTGLYYSTDAAITGVDYWTLSGAMLISQYNIGNEYSVKTIQPLCFYAGTTYTTTVNGSFGSDAYKNTTMLYRVKLDFEKNKAQVVIYDAQFAEAMPKLSAVVLEDLDVNLDDGTYTITGENIIPKMPDGGVLTPNEKYKFNNFELNFNGDDTLTKAHIDYTVASMFKGSFSGAYIIEHNFNN